MNKTGIEKATQITSRVVQANWGQDGSSMEGEWGHQQTSKILGEKTTNQPNKTHKKATQIDVFSFSFFYTDIN